MPCVCSLCLFELICTARQTRAECSDQESIISYDLIVLQYYIDFFFPSPSRCVGVNKQAGKPAFKDPKESKKKRFVQAKVIMWRQGHVCLRRGVLFGVGFFFL